MMPRRSPPTAIGFPRNFGSPACSTAAKNASASRWTMTRGMDARGVSVHGSVNRCTCPLIFRFANERAEHALNHQFLGRNQVGILWILRLQERFAALQNESLQRAFTINKRCYDLAVTRIWSVFKHHDVTVADVLSSHRIAV